MLGLKQRLAGIAAHLPVDRPILYLDYPIHLNIGDLLIMRGTERYFADFGYRILGRSTCLNFHRRIANRLTPDTTIVLHGGGNFGDLYPIHQRFRESVVERYRTHKIVVMPQTLWFGSQAALEASARIFQRHPDLTLFVRDRPSLALASGRFSDRVVLMPDMAHQLWDEATGRLQPTRRGTLLLWRKDVEATAMPHLAVAAAPIDWIDLIPVWQRRVYGQIQRAHRYEGAIELPLGAQRAWYVFHQRLIERMAGVFLQHDAVVTNRLHACIFAALLGRPVTFVDNSYGKLGNYFDAWLRDVPGIQKVVTSRTPAHA
jgi:pyruvyl transferase EpsO